MPAAAYRQSASPSPAWGLAAEARIRRYQRGIWRFLRFLGCSPDEADDLTQEALLVLLRAPVQGDPEDTERWLRGVARNLFRAHGRRRRRGLELLSPAEIEAAWARFAPRHGDHGDGYIARVRSCLARLRPRERSALLGRFAEDMPLAALAETLNLRVEGLRSLLGRAKARLRSCIAATPQFDED